MKYQRLLWATWDIGGIPVNVWLSHDSISPDLVGVSGCTTEDNGVLEVYIDIVPEKPERLETALHEFVHACLWRKASLGLHWKKEECIAQEIANAGRKNFHMPRYPAGTRALETYCRNLEAK